MQSSDDLYGVSDVESDGEATGVTGEQGQHELNSMEEADLHSPSDGYFGGSDPAPETTSSSAFGNSPRQSSNVPVVPNVWVSDPTLDHGSTADSKASEAAQERAAGDRATTSSSVAAHHSPPPSTPQSGTRSTRRLASPSVVTSSQPSTSYSYTPFTQSRSAFAEHTPPSVLPNEAPPAYTPSATVSSPPISPASPTRSSPPATPSSSSQHPRTDHHRNSSRNYSTFADPEMGRDELQGLLDREPESMADAPLLSPEHETLVPVWRRKVQRGRSGLGRKCCVGLLALVLLAMTSGFLATFIQAVRNEKDSDQPERPPNSYPDTEKDLDWIPSMSCRNLHHKMPTSSLDVEFSEHRSFTLKQEISERSSPHLRPVRVGGVVYLRRSGEGTPGPSIVLEAITNDDRVEVHHTFDSGSQEMRITVPPSVPWDTGTSDWPCVMIRATLWVPPDATLGTLTIDTVHLDVQLLDNLALQVPYGVKLASVAGDIVAGASASLGRHFDVKQSPPPYFNFDGRSIEVHATSGSIRGFWPLYDLLLLETTSGDVAAHIDPKSVKKDAPAPARLQVKCTSGDVELWEPVDKVKTKDTSAEQAARDAIPPRDYQVSVSTTSGNVKAGLAMSSEARFESTSGNLELDLLPVLDDAHTCVSAAEASANGLSVGLHTATTSGTTSVRVRDPLWADFPSGNALPNVPNTPNAPNAPNTPNTPDAPIPPRLPGLPGDVDQPDTFPTVPIGNGDPYDLLPLGRGRRGGASQDDGAAAAATVEKRVAAADRKKVLGCLTARHTTTSANVWLRYPASWEGDVDVRTLSGNIRARGEGLRVIDSGDGGWSGILKHLLGRKGEDKGLLVEVKTTSGNVEFVVGED